MAQLRLPGGSGGSAGARPGEGAATPGGPKGGSPGPGRAGGARGALTARPQLRAAHQAVPAGADTAGEAGDGGEGQPKIAEPEAHGAVGQGQPGALGEAVVEEDEELGRRAAQGGLAADGDVGAHGYHGRGLDPDAPLALQIRGTCGKAGGLRGYPAGAGGAGGLQGSALLPGVHREGITPRPGRFEPWDGDKPGGHE